MRVGDYELLQPRGRGASGVLYRAEHVDREGTVAVKELVLAGQADWTPMDRFDREAKALSSLEHPGIVRFIEAFEAEGERGPALYIVSELVEGPTLGEQIDDGRRWNEGEARALLRSLLQTLDYLHTLSPRVVHRDIKPGNIVMRDGTEPVLIDFGAVVDAAPTGDGGLTVAGTAGYMAPEQAMGARDPRSDLYAVGATLVHALTHVHPVALAEDGLRIGISDRVGTSPGFVAILQRLVEPDPTDRFASAAEAIEALDAPAVVQPEGALAVRGSTALQARPPRPLTPAVVRTLTASRALGTLTAARFVLWSLFAFIPGLVITTVFPGPVSPVWGIATMLALTAMGLGVRRARDRRLYRDGTAIVGEVVSLRNNNQAITVRYRYEVDGRPYEGVLATRELSAVHKLDRGSPLTVLHDPNAPARSVALLPDELAAIEAESASESA